MATGFAPTGIRVNSKAVGAVLRFLESASAGGGGASRRMTGYIAAAAVERHRVLIIGGVRDVAGLGADRDGRGDLSGHDIHHGQVAGVAVGDEEILRGERHRAGGASDRPGLIHHTLVGPDYDDGVEILAGYEQLSFVGLEAEVLGLDRERQVHHGAGLRGIEDGDRAAGAVAADDAAATVVEADELGFAATRDQAVECRT